MSLKRLATLAVPALLLLVPVAGLSAMPALAASAPVRPSTDGPAGSAPAPVLLRSVHVSTPAAIVHPNNPLSPVSTGQAGYPVTPAMRAKFLQPGPPATSSDAAPVSHLAPLPSANTVSPATPNPPTGLEKYTINNGAPYGDPPDNNMDTDGGSAAFMYNDGNGERLDYLSLYGNGTPYGGFNLCGLQGYTGCSDPVVRYDRVNGDDRWIFAYEDFTPGQPGGGIVLGISYDYNLSDGFAMYAIGKQTAGSLDAPRLGISSDKVIITYNYYNSGNISTVFLVINKPQLESIQGFNFHEYGGVGYNYTPVGVTGYEATTMSEAPDFSTGGSNMMVTHYIYGPEGSEQFITRKWLVQNLSGSIPRAGQPGTTDTLNTDSNEFNSSAYSGNLLWMTGNNSCQGSDSSLYACSAFLGFSVDSAGQPTGISVDDDLLATGVNYFYAAISPTSSNTTMGVVDYTCPSCGSYAGAVTFEMDGTGAINGGPPIYGNSDIPANNGGTSHPWGDYNSCAYIPASSPSQSACVGEFALNGSTASELFVNQVS